MHVTFDLSEIEEMMLQQARKQLETELETTLHSFGDVCCLYTAVLVSPVQSIVQSSPQSSPRSSPESSFYRDPVFANNCTALESSKVGYACALTIIRKNC